MKNGPGYLDVAVSSYLDMLKAQGSCPRTMRLEDYAQQVRGEAHGGWLAGVMRVPP